MIVQYLYRVGVVGTYLPGFFLFALIQGLEKFKAWRPAFRKTLWGVSPRAVAAYPVAPAHPN